MSENAGFGDWLQQYTDHIEDSIPDAEEVSFEELPLEAQFEKMDYVGSSFRMPLDVISLTHIERMIIEKTTELVEQYPPVSRRYKHAYEESLKRHADLTDIKMDFIGLLDLNCIAEGFRRGNERLRRMIMISLYDYFHDTPYDVYLFPKLAREFSKEFACCINERGYGSFLSGSGDDARLLVGIFDSILDYGPKFESFCENCDDEAYGSFLFLVAKTLSRESIDDMLFNFPRIIALLDNFDSADPAIMEFFERAKLIVCESVANQDWELVERICHHQSQTIADMAVDEVHRYLETTFGIERCNVREEWKLYYAFQGEDTDKYDQYSGDLRANIDCMELLEEECEGSVRELYTKFRIKEFRRYDTRVLKRMYENRNEDIPYACLAFSNSDWNNAFDYDKAVITSISDQLNALGIDLRIVEFGSGFSLMKRLTSLDKMYGDEHKIEGLILGAHGSKDGFGVFRGNRVAQEDLSGLGVGRMSKFFVDNPSVALFSCSTGALGGFGQELSKTFRAIVSAPDIPTSVSSVEVFLEGDQIRFKVNYVDRESSRMYSNGKEMRKTIE